MQMICSVLLVNVKAKGEERQEVNYATSSIVSGSKELEAKHREQTTIIHEMQEPSYSALNAIYR